MSLLRTALLSLFFASTAGADSDEHFSFERVAESLARARFLIGYSGHGQITCPGIVSRLSQNPGEIASALEDLVSQAIRSPALESSLQRKFEAMDKVEYPFVLNGNPFFFLTEATGVLRQLKPLSAVFLYLEHPGRFSSLNHTAELQSTLHIVRDLSPAELGVHRERLRYASAGFFGYVKDHVATLVNSNGLLARALLIEHLVGAEVEAKLDWLARYSYQALSIATARSMELDLDEAFLDRLVRRTYAVLTEQGDSEDLQRLKSSVLDRHWFDEIGLDLEDWILDQV